MTIRPWEPRDTERLLTWVDEDPDIFASLGMENPDRALLIQAMTAAMVSPHWGIYAAENGTGKAIACLGLNSTGDGTALVHMWLSPRHRGRGYWVGKAGLDYAFNTLGLKSVIGVVPKTNDLALELDMKLGFEPIDAHFLQLTREQFNGE
jgi:RimJ/RimL family protein N-acetyltransferase